MKLHTARQIASTPIPSAKTGEAKKRLRLAHKAETKNRKKYGQR